MKIDFPLIAITNFGSFNGGPHELDLASYGVGCHFLRGRNDAEPALEANGSGKSTIWNALCWCLYGRTVDGRRNPDIQPRFGGKQTVVVLICCRDDQPQTIARSTNPNRLTINNKEVGQEQIDDLIGMDFSVFTNTILFGQGQPLFFDLQPKAKMDLFSAVLNLDRWEVRADAASEKTKELQLEESSLAAEAQGLESQFAHTEQLYETIRQKWADWRDELERQKAAAAERLKTLKAEAESKGNERAGYELAYDSAATELKAAQEGSRVLAGAGEKLILERSQFTTQKAVAESSVTKLKTELKKLGEADKCPTCRQSIKGTDLSRHKAELKKQLDQESLKLIKATNGHDALTVQISKHQAKVTLSREAEREFQSRSEEARSALDRIGPAIARAEAEIAQLVAQAKKQEKEINPYTEQTNELRRRKTQLEAEHKEAMNQLVQTRERIERTRFWIKGFKEVRLFVIEEVLQELELVTNASLPSIGLVDWEVQYAIEKETKSGTIQRGLNVFIRGPRDKSPVRWECWSGGEGQRLRLIGALSLAEVLLARAGVEPGMEVLDEPTQHLSKRGIVDLCEFLSERARALGKSIWYTDHNAVDSAQFDSVLTVVKTKKGSELVA